MTVEVAVDGDLGPVAELVCADLRPGDAVHLSGSIGAGKTALVRACASRLGVDGPVTSPTFALSHRYTGSVPIVHIDLYRLQDQPVRDVDDIRAELGGEAIGFVEWPEVGASWLPPARRSVQIEVAPDGRRRFVVETHTVPGRL